MKAATNKLMNLENEQKHKESRSESFGGRLQHHKQIVCTKETNSEEKPTQNDDVTKPSNRRFRKRKEWRTKQRKKKEKSTYDFTNNVIHNYSSHTLTKPMETLLQRGLNFTVTPNKVNTTDLLQDVKKFERKIKWREHFQDDDTPAPQQIFKSTEKTNVPPHNSQCIKDFLAGVRGELLGSKRNRVRPNINPEEKEALETLKQLQLQRKIVIKPSDKGAGITICDFETYDHEVKEHLCQRNEMNNPYYEKVTDKYMKEAKHEIMEALHEGYDNGFMSRTEYEEMKPTDKGPGRFYIIPKVHKPVKPNHILPPCRPIVAGCGSITENVSKFIDYHSKDLVKNIPSYIQDTPDLLRKLEAVNASVKIPENSFPISIDVIGLYTNIPHEEGEAAFKKALSKRSNPEIPAEFLIQLLHLVLKYNILEYDEELYRQTHGTAMGTPVAPTYANFFMADIDELVKTCTSASSILFLFRFLDDILIWWTSSIEALEQFLQDINKLHDTIKFTASYDYELKTCQFLDLTIQNKDGLISTDLYRKPTDAVKHLFPSPAQPRHVSKIPHTLWP